MKAIGKCEVCGGKIIQAGNGGFENWFQMKNWFDNEDKQYVGKIIFWKNFK